MTRALRLADAFERYATLIVAQLQALEQGDLDALEPLGQERDTLAGEIDSLLNEAPHLAEQPDARLQLQRCNAADQRFRARLAVLRGDTRTAVLRERQDAEAMRVYAGAEPPGSRLDIEL